MDWKNKVKVMALFVVLSLLLYGCFQKEDKQSIQFFSMDTIMKITAYGEHAQDGLAQAKDTILTLETELDSTKSNSEIAQLKDGNTVSTFIQYPLNIAQQISTLTDGALDLRLYPLTEAWGFYSKNYRVPESVEIQGILNNLGTWSLQKNVYSCSENMQLDLGSVAKGYAASKAVEIMRNSGVTSAILSLGGNVQTLGLKPDGSTWKVSVADPLHDGETVGDLSIGECAVVTSGSYQRNFTQNGKTYHHILNPKTGYPVENDLLSVTVLCDDGTMADGLSTALFVLGTDKSMDLYKNSDISFEALFITKNQTIIMTEGVQSLFTKTNEKYTISQ